MDKEIWLNQETEKLTAEELTMLVGDADIKVIGFSTHRKASEAYVIISAKDGNVWNEWYIPYEYRRTNTFIDSAADLAQYIISKKEFLSAVNIENYKKALKRQTSNLFGKRAKVTSGIFKKLLNDCGKWVCTNLFKNNNPQRRIQDIKERGFTLSTKIERKMTYHMLLPFDIVKAPTYETIPEKVRDAIFKALGNFDAYGNKPVGRSALPDHKFPEPRWAAGTAESNEGLTEEEMRKKFQLIPENANQTKREVCGTFAGIEFFYKGDANWPANIPKTGKVAEAGCVGCFWYDMTAWRTALNQLIKGAKDDDR